MKNLQLILLVVFTSTFVTKNFAQPKSYAIKNSIGIEGGITKFNIITNNFKTSQGDGWVGSLSATVNLPHKWYNLSYSIQLSESNFGISGRASNINTEQVDIEHKVLAAQIALLWHAKIVKSYFTIDYGPMIQYNSKLELINEAYTNFLVNGYEQLEVKDISEVSNFGINGVVGATLGISRFKVQGQYIYGINNILNKLNSNKSLNLSGNENKFKGNTSMLVFTAIISI